MSEYIISSTHAEHIYTTGYEDAGYGDAYAPPDLDDRCGVQFVAEKITRCKDCNKFRRKGEQLFDSVAERDACTRFSYWDAEWDVVYFHYVDELDFCSWGEMKVDE